MNRRNFLTALAAVPAVMSLAVPAAQPKEEPTAYTITETEDLLILSGTAKGATFDCKGKILYLKGYCDVTHCSFNNVTHYACEVHPDSCFENNTISFSDTESSVL